MGSSSDATIVDLPGLQRRLTEEAAEWLSENRRIRWSTAGKMPVASGAVFFGQLDRRSEAIFFRYPDGWRARAWPEKAFTSKTGTRSAFWNLEAVLAGPMTDVWITEGELDAMSLVEAGVGADQVLAAPGAPRATDKPVSDGAYAYVGEALAAGLGAAKRFIWCGDQDAAGLRLRADMAKLLGPGKLHFVEWPEGCKDANDYLRSDGAETLHDRVTKGFLPWPIDGLYQLSKIPDRAPLAVWKTGFQLWDERLHLAAGTLSVVTGHPGMGKTLLWVQVWQQVVSAYDLVACVASFETRPKPHLRRQLRSLVGGAREDRLDERTIREADDWIDGHYLFALHPDRRPELNWLLFQAEAAVARHGAKILQVDPWNRLEASREPKESETDYILRCLRELYNFAVDLDCHVQVIAHPSKMDSLRRGQPPGLEDIAGSKHWENLTDQGFVVHRPKMFDDEGNRETYAEVHHAKCRFDELGFATKLGIDYDVEFGKFYSCKLRRRGKRKADGDQDE